MPPIESWLFVAPFVLSALVVTFDAYLARFPRRADDIWRSRRAPQRPVPARVPVVTRRSEVPPAG